MLEAHLWADQYGHKNRTIYKYDITQGSSINERDKTQLMEQ